jgi:putative membrane protein
MLPSLTLLSLLHAGASISLTSFTVHWSTVVGLVALAVLYEWQAAGGRRQAGLSFSRFPPAACRLPFYSGLTVIFFSLNGWLHDLSDYYLFSAHMVQHLLLTLLVPPLLIAGTPGWMLRPLLRHPVVGSIARVLTRPKVCFATFNVVVAAWHLPVLYNLAMAHHGIHIVQHLMFMGAAVMLWWPILSPLPELPRLSYPAQMLYLFLTTIPMSIVAVFITYSESLLYPAYAASPRIFGITPLQDQLIGGLIMWIPGGLIFFAVISVIFFRWQTRGAEDSAASAQVDWRPATDA